MAVDDPAGSIDWSTSESTTIQQEEDQTAVWTSGRRHRDIHLNIEQVLQSPGDSDEGAWLTLQTIPNKMEGEDLTSESETNQAEGK